MSLLKGRLYGEAGPFCQIFSVISAACMGGCCFVIFPMRNCHCPAWFSILFLCYDNGAPGPAKIWPDRFRGGCTRFPDGLYSAAGRAHCFSGLGALNRGIEETIFPPGQAGYFPGKEVHESCFM